MILVEYCASLNQSHGGRTYNNSLQTVSTILVIAKYVSPRSVIISINASPALGLLV